MQPLLNVKNQKIIVQHSAYIGVSRKRFIFIEYVVKTPLGQKSGVEEEISSATEALKNTNSIQCFCASVANHKLRSNFCKTLWSLSGVFAVEMFFSKICLCETPMLNVLKPACCHF